MREKDHGVYHLIGVVKNYDWGGTEFLSELLSIPNPNHEPMAEYWLGAHETSPSVVVSNDHKPLNRFISADPERNLGSKVTKRFGRLPFLLKVLDVRNMLSIQVHPSKHTAEVEFARENKAKVPLDAANRNYKDDNHKPELMVALSEFWLLHGFKPIDGLRARLQSIPEFISLLQIFDETGYDQLYKTVMEMPQQSVNEMLDPLLTRIIPQFERQEFNKDQEEFWVARAATSFGDKTHSGRSGRVDRGIFSIYFFNLLHLRPGEGIFQDAGVPHAYLEGKNVEVMASSDNVLRGGLTSKYIDVKELMKNIKFEATIPQIILPQRTRENEQQYKTAAPDFKLSRFQLKKSMLARFQSVTGEIVLVLSGSVLLRGERNEIELKKGEAAFISADQDIGLHVLSDVDLFRASVPVHHID